MPLLIRNRTFQFLLVTLLVFVGGCAHQPDPSLQLPPEELALSGQLMGFLVGLFHGFTIVFNMVASLIFNVRIYTFPNSGRLYDLGYVLGAAAFLSGGARASRRDPKVDWLRERQE
jgi:hypothetical protein